MPWIFESKPMVEWRFQGDPDSSEGLPSEGHLFAYPSKSIPSQPYPSDPLVHYVDFLDSSGKHTTLARLEFDGGSQRCAELVELFWSLGLPVILEMKSPVPVARPIWFEIFRIRAIELPESGRLGWQPLVSWTIGNDFVTLEPGLQSWLAWTNANLPPPLLRLDFSKGAGLSPVRHALEALRETTFPYWLRLVSMDSGDRQPGQSQEWTHLLEEQTYDQTELLETKKVINLFPASGSPDEASE